MKGIGASPGIAIGKALVIKKQANFVTGIPLETSDDVRREIQKFELAVTSATEEIRAIGGNQEFLEIQIELLQDEQIRADVVGKITADNKNANDAVIEVIEQALETFRNLKDEYFSARAADVQDAGNRILRHLNGSLSITPAVTEENTVIIAEDISPSDAITLDITKVTGIATQAGSRTSHAAIIAKARGIAAVVGCGTGLHSIKTNDPVIVDGTEGLVIVRPSQIILDEYIFLKEAFGKQAALLSSLKDVAATTTDGVTVKLLANISSAEKWNYHCLMAAREVGCCVRNCSSWARTLCRGKRNNSGFIKGLP
jgi:phosphotransferase system enzyme I (PtsI)